MNSLVDKLIEEGPSNLTDTEVLSLVIGSGIRNKPAIEIAKEILAMFGSFEGMANQPLEKFLKVKGLGDAKICRIATAFELAKRCAEKVLKEKKKNELQITNYDINRSIDILMASLQTGQWALLNKLIGGTQYPHTPEEKHQILLKIASLRNKTGLDKQTK